jgi:hypothetical protein
MATCTFCGSKDVRRSLSSTLDTAAVRVMRALTFRCLYRCRSCDALFEAIGFGSILTRGQPGNHSGKRNNHQARSGSESAAQGKTGSVQPLVPQPTSCSDATEPDRMSA